MMEVTHIFLFAFLLAGISTSDAVQCYECSTRGSGDACRYPTENTYSGYCSGPCVKEVDGDDISRSCTSFCRSGTNSGGFIYCCNDRDYCNTGSRHQLGLSVGLAGTLIAIGWQMMYF